MSYTKVGPFVNGSAPYISATNLNQMESGIAAAHAQAGAVLVASSAASASVKAICDYVCDGTADQVEINQALVAASRPSDGFGGTGRIKVLLVGPTFTIAAPISMPPSVTLSGNGRGTLIQPPGTSDSQDVGAIQLLNSNCHGVTIENLTIGRLSAQKTNWDMIRLLANATGNNYEIWTGSDSFSLIRNVTTLDTNGKGIVVGGISGANGNREAQIDGCYIWNSLDYGIHVWGGSDAKIRNCVVGGGNQHGIVLAGGNSAVDNSKVYYRGNYSGGTAGSHGFYITSSRCRVTACEAQDNNGYGLYVTSTGAIVSGFHADSNMARSTSYGGVYVGGDGTYEGISCVTRAQNTYQQDKGVVFGSGVQAIVTGRVSVDAGNAHVSGTPSAGSFVRLVRGGGSESTLYSFG